MTPKRQADRSGRFSTWMRSIWRQRWLSLVSAWTICVMGWAAIALWPSSYMSSAVVYADLHRLVDEVGIGKEDASDEPAKQGPVDLLKTVLLNEESLADIRKAAGLDGDDAVSIASNFMIRTTAPTLFVTSYDHRDPEVAHLVLERLFANIDQKLEEIGSANTSKIEEEIADLESELAIANATLSEFEQTNAGLFDEAATDRTDVAELEQELAGLKQRIEDAIVERDEVAEQLAQLPSSQQAPGDQAPADELTEAEASEIANLEARLVELRERYADSHPYVSTVVEQIEAIKAGGSTDGSAADGGENNAAELVDADQLNDRLVDLQQLHEEKIADVADLNNELANKRREIDRLKALTDTTSSAEAERSGLLADKAKLETALAELALRLDEARRPPGAQQEQDQSKGNEEQSSFRLINGPNLPERPTGLPRLLGLALVLIGGLTIGGLTAVARNRSKGVFESAWELKQRFDVGVLGTISEVLTPAERKRLGYSRLGFGLGCVGLMTVFGGLAVAEFLNLLTPWGDSLRTQLLG